MSDREEGCFAAANASAVGADTASVAELRVVTDPPGGGPLTAAALAGRVPADWYPPRPTSPREWRERAALVGQPEGRWLERLRPAFGATGRIDRLEDVARAGGAVVTTGQQPGLFGGPIYTWSKALSALELADAIEEASGVATAPVFWAATDDADYAEASVTHVAVPGGLETLRMPGPATDRVPMARVPLGDVRGLLGRLERGAGSAAYADALAAVRRAYDRPGGATVGSAYVALLRELLEPLGIAVLDASHPAVREAGAPLMRRALSGAREVAEALAARDRALRSAGFTAQVAPVPDLSLVFENDARGTKDRAPIAGAAELAERAPDEALSPNVLLRPVMERAILPTVAYVAGPGELAYFAQVSAVAAALGAGAPLAVPRWSGTVIEPQIARLLGRLGLQADALRDPHAAEGRLARAAMPGELRDALAAAREAAAQAIERVRVAGAGVVPDAVPEGAGRSLGGRLERLERRYVAAFKQREGAVMREVATARAALWPLGNRQERVLNFIPLLARHGPALVGAMRAAAGAAMRSMVTAAAEAPR